MPTTYGTIVADPPWRYKTKSPLAKGGGGAEKHYPTMSNDEIRDLAVGSLAAKDAHLYMWVTNPHLFGGGGDVTPSDIMEAWGFRYITLITWVKQGALGMGYYWRGDTEHILFGVKGKAPIPPADRKRNVFEAPKRRHSEKPDTFLDLVEQVSPGPRIELFARRQRFGWDTWGNESFESVNIEGGNDA